MCSFWGGSHVFGVFLNVSACLSVWVSSFFAPAPPPRLFFPPRSSDPSPTCSSRPPPQPPAGPYEGVGGGGQAPPSPRSGIGWLRLQQEGSEERDISADRGGTVGRQPEMSLMREAKVAPAPGKRGRERLHFLSSATDPSPNCLNFFSCTECPIPTSTPPLLPLSPLLSDLHFSLPHTHFPSHPPNLFL